MPNLISMLQQNIDQVESRISQACDKSGRSREEVQLIAVTKYAELPWVEALLELEYSTLGESRPQQLLKRAELLPEYIQWHMIGQLQRNKIRKLLPVASLIHSVDSLKLLSAIERVALEEHLKPQVLLQVNLSGEGTKQGFTEEELKSNWGQIEAFTETQVCGLMTMAPKMEEVEQSRPCFSALRKLRDELIRQSTRHSLKHLSMGMSRDFEVAVEEGATLIRIGSQLYSGLGES